MNAAVLVALFCVSEAAVSARMGQDRVQDHVKNGAQVIVGSDVVVPDAPRRCRSSGKAAVTGFYT